MPSSTDLVHAVSADLEKIREAAPLVLSLTNSVVQPLTANLLLAAGAVPAMLNDAEEAVEMLRGGAGALLVNLGTVTREQGAVMQTAVQEANRLGIPWVLDPVAVGALSLRTRLAEQLKERRPRIIRGNASEIMALAGYSSVTKGPESTSSSADALQAARELALHTGAAVLVTGRTDYSTDGRQVIATENGHAMMSRVTGVGCSMGALAAACAAVSSSPLQAAVSTAVLMGIAGEMAFEQSPAPGSFAVSLLDSLYSLSPEEVARRARILPLYSSPFPSRNRGKAARRTPSGMRRVEFTGHFYSFPGTERRRNTAPRAAISSMQEDGSGTGAGAVAVNADAMAEEASGAAFGVHTMLTSLESSFFWRLHWPYAA